ncbi:MAG: methylmalonyl-CoA mutase family protein, partial [Acidimicrobiia bacterium]
FDEDTQRKTHRARSEWEEQVGPRSEREGTTSSGIPVPPVFDATDLAHIDVEDIGMPGRFPYTRGAYPLQHQTVGWMNQQVHGFGTPEQTNERMNALLSQGMAGYGDRPVFNLVFDLPTQEGFDADDPVAEGRVGLSGVSVSTVDDLDRLFAGFDPAEINASLIMADPSLAILAMYIVLAERRGVPAAQLRGNTMNFLYNTFHMDRHGFPPRKAMRLIVELITYATAEMPRWNTTNLCGYNIRQSGATSVQELAYTRAVSAAITEACLDAGLAPDDFLPRFGFQICVDNDLFEDVAKIRALRRMWATMNRERFGAEKPRSHQARIHVHTSGAALTAQQPQLNIARAALHTLAAVLGGANSIQTSAHDEALSIPTEKAAVLALRTQQMIRFETGAANVTDPLGGSYYLEWLTDRIVSEAKATLDELETEGGGFMAAWQSGWLRARIAEQSYRDQESIVSGEKVVIGVNRFREEATTEIPVFAVAAGVEAHQVERLASFRRDRDTTETERRLEALRSAIREDGALMEPVLQCFRADATLGEVMGVFRKAWTRGTVYGR